MSDLMERLDVIVARGGRYYVYSENRKRRLGGPYRSRGQAERRLAQVEYFKHARHDDAASTLREVALHRAFGPGGPTRPTRRRRGRLPKQILPRPLEVEYAKALVQLVRHARRVYQPLLDSLPSLVRKDGDGDGARWDAPGDTVKARRLLDQAQRELERAVSGPEVERLAQKFAARTSTYQRIQLGRQVKAALGADPFVRDKVLGGLTEDFVHHNVSLITRIPKKLHDKVESAVMQAVSSSNLNVDLAAHIEDAFGVAERHAKLIARDQIGKFFGQVNRARQKEMGVRKFIWRTVGDERVRDSHADLDGETFSWDDLPTNDEGELIYPGSDIQCRCGSEPAFDDLLDSLEEEEGDADQLEHVQPESSFGDEE